MKIKTDDELALLQSIDRAYQSIDKALQNEEYKAGLIEAKFELRATLKLHNAFLHEKKRD